MALINRMSRLLTADIHAVLDRLEEPEALLRQALREMDEALALGEQRLRGLEQERESTTARARQIEGAQRELEAELDACFAAGNDGLARKLMRRKLENERFRKYLAERLQGLDQTLAAERARLAEQREQLEVLRQKAELVGETPVRRPDERFGTEFAVGDDEVEAALLRERLQRNPS